MQKNLYLKKVTMNTPPCFNNTLEKGGLFCFYADRLSLLVLLSFLLQKEEN